MIHTGALESDASRKIAKIEYDNFNNPVRIQFTNGNVTKYIYSATGEKLRVIYQTAVANINVAIGSTKELASSQIQSTETVDYLLGGALTLRNGRIDKYQFEEGYCQASAAGSVDYFDSYYYDRDHLGNIRRVIIPDDNPYKSFVIQTMDYYPFGAEFCDYSTKNFVQNHKYNGKEFDHMHGLNTYDYGARQYNPVTGRWDRMDPLSEDYYATTPYAYCLNNPVKNIDPDGKAALNALAGGIGAGVGAAAYAYIAYCEGKSSDEIWGAAAEGAIVGGVTGLTLGTNLSVGAAVGIGFSSSAAGNATNQMISNGKVDTGEVGYSAIVGGVIGCIGNAAGNYVNKLGGKVVKEIETKAANTVANARSIAYEQVKSSLTPSGEPVKMGGKYAKRQINKMAPKIAKEAEASAASAKQTAQKITKGKNWSVQMGIGNVASKVSDACSDMKKKVKSIIGKWF